MPEHAIRACFSQLLLDLGLDAHKINIPVWDQQPTNEYLASEIRNNVWQFSHVCTSLAVFSGVGVGVISGVGVMAAGVASVQVFHGRLLQTRSRNGSSPVVRF